MANPLCHFEFMTDNPQKTRAFYSRVFDWIFDDKSMSGYTLIDTETEFGGGLMQRPPNCPHPVLQVYFLVKNIDATLGKVTAGGGQVLVPKTEIPHTGQFAVFSDPDGIAVGIFQGQGG